MGKKRGFFSAVKKALSVESKKSENPKNKSSKKNDTEETVVAVPPTPPNEPVKTENDHGMHVYSVAIATAAAAEAAATAARAAAAEVARLTATFQQSGRLKEETAAIKIQTAFRAHLAKRTLRALRGLARLKSMIQGQSVQRQSMIALQCMQTLSRVQSQIRSSRVRMSDVNPVLHQQLQQKCEKEFDKLRAEQVQQKCEKDSNKLKAPVTVDGDWNSSAASKEQIEAKLQNKEEAAKKRERALAYSHSHQRVRKNSTKLENLGNPTSKPENPGNPTVTDQTDPFWGWSWLEGWKATRPWENKATQDRPVDADHDDISVKSNPSRVHTPKPKPPLSTPPPKARSLGPKTRPACPKESVASSDQSSLRRHSIGGSLARNDDKKASSKTVSTSVLSTEAAKAGAKSASRLGNGKPEKGSLGSARKQLSYSTSSPGVRRLSGPPKIDATS